MGDAQRAICHTTFGEFYLQLILITNYDMKKYFKYFNKKKKYDTNWFIVFFSHIKTIFHVKRFINNPS